MVDFSIERVVKYYILLLLLCYLFLILPFAGTGRGGKSIYGDQFADEIHPKLKHTGAGIISMANSGPNSNGSQFFLTLAPTRHLDGLHTIFGRVSGGIGILNRMGMIQTDEEDRPTEPISINATTLLD